MHQYIKIIIIVVIVITGLFLFLYFFGGSFIDKFSPALEVTQQSNESESGKAVLGKDAPYFDLLSLSGTRVRLSDLAGSGSVLTFWSTWNSESVDQIKIFDDYLTKNLSSGKVLPINIIAIDSQEVESVPANFIRRGGYDIKVLTDPSGQTSNDYGVQTLPTTFFLDSNGKVLEIFVGTMSETMLVDKIEKIIK